jgi:hypothetical protein
MQQSSPVKLVQRRKQLAHCQVAQGAEQGESARFYRNREHNVCSFIKLGYKYLF